MWIYRLQKQDVYQYDDKALSTTCVVHHFSVSSNMYNAFQVRVGGRGGEEGGKYANNKLVSLTIIFMCNIKIYHDQFTGCSMIKLI